MLLAALMLYLQESVGAVYLEAYLGTLNTVQVLLLAWIGYQTQMSAEERKRRRREEGIE